MFQRNVIPFRIQIIHKRDSDKNVVHCYWKLLLMQVEVKKCCTHLKFTHLEGLVKPFAIW